MRCSSERLHEIKLQALGEISLCKTVFWWNGTTLV